MRKESESRENVEPKLKRRKLHVRSKISEGPKKENRDNAISKKGSVLDKRDKLLHKLKRMKKAKQMTSSRMSKRPRSRKHPEAMMRGKKTSLMLRSMILRTKMMKLKVVMMLLIRRQLTKKLIINKMLSNLKRMPKKIPESLKILCQLKLRGVVLDQNKMLNSVVNKRQLVVADVVEEKVLKWSIGLKSKLLPKPMEMAKIPKETSKKLVQRIKRRTLKLKLMQL